MPTPLPLGKTQFFDQNGNPLAGGTVAHYIPGTTTPSTTWQDSGGTIPNANPLTLDAGGWCTIWGLGSYRQVVKDALGNTIWDQVTETSLSTLADLKSYGAAGNGTTDDTAAVTSASASAWVPVGPGSYKTTIASSSLSGTFFGGGYIIDAASHHRGKIFSALHAAPSSLSSNIYSVETVFDGDYSKQNLAVEHRVYGSSTLGTPTTGFSVYPQAFPLTGYLYNESGHIQNNATGDGQTGIGFAFINVEHHGQGNACGLTVYGQSYGTNPSATGWLAYPSIGMLAGQVTAGATGQYLNAVEVHCNDNGFDSASINFVATMFRDNATGANGAPWVAYLGASQGSQAPDALLLGQGAMKSGIDLSPCTFTNQAAIVLGANQRIYMDATNTNGYPSGTTYGGGYITDFSGVITIANGTSRLGVGTTGTTIVNPVSIQGAVTPSADNTYTLGASGARWSAVWAANGTIQTSDPGLKTDIAPLPAALPIVKALGPVTYKWKVGGTQIVEEQEEQDVPVLEEFQDEATTIELRDGQAVQVKTTITRSRPIYDSVPVVDEAGSPVMIDVGGKQGPVRMVQKMHQVPRTEKKMVPVEKRVDRAGQRTHWGFLASDVKAAFEATGLDFGGYVRGEDGTDGIRPDQLIPALWKAVQELAAQVEAIQAALPHP